jgi:hypothetical protein
MRAIFNSSSSSSSPSAWKLSRRRRWVAGYWPQGRVGDSSLLEGGMRGVTEEEEEEEDGEEEKEEEEEEEAVQEVLRRSSAVFESRLRMRAIFNSSSSSSSPSAWKLTRRRRWVAGYWSQGRVGDSSLIEGGMRGVTRSERPQSGDEASLSSFKSSEPRLSESESRLRSSPLSSLSPVVLSAIPPKRPGGPTQATTVSPWARGAVSVSCRPASHSVRLPAGRPSRAATVFLKWSMSSAQSNTAVSPWGVFTRIDRGGGGARGGGGGGGAGSPSRGDSSPVSLPVWERRSRLQLSLVVFHFLLLARRRCELRRRPTYTSFPLGVCCPCCCAVPLVVIPGRNVVPLSLVPKFWYASPLRSIWCWNCDRM